MTDIQPPLTWEASASPTSPITSSSLPPEVIQCLSNARYLHLATCSSQHPHIALMNYTYLPSTPFAPRPTIVMTTNLASKKTHNLLVNPHVSLLVHDWTSSRPAAAVAIAAGAPLADASSSAPIPPRRPAPSSLANLLLNINTSALSSISATIDGEARVLRAGSDEEQWCKARHLENHDFGNEPHAEVEGERRFIEGEDVRVVVVMIQGVRIADWKGGVKDWVISNGEEMINGVN